MNCCETDWYLGIRDNKTRERLLREPALTLARTDEVCHAAESTVTQLKLVEDHTTNVSVLDPPIKECSNCGRRHPDSQRCPALGKTCRKCQKKNHFAAKCRSTRTRVRTVDEEDLTREEENDTMETFPLQLPVHCLDNSQFVTLRIQSGNFIRFQVDTGAQCNVLPLSTYKQATGDVTLSKITAAHTKVTAYGGGTLPVVGTTLLKVWRDKSRYLLECKLIDSRKIRPLLGRKACLGMKIIAYLDNDELHKPDTRNAPVYAVEDPAPVTIEGLVAQHPDVFGPGVGLLAGKYHIVLDDKIPPVQHPPRRVPVPVRGILKETLDELVQQDILAPVQQPTQWISSMVVVPKKDGKPRICLDPRDLNQAIRREYYPLPTIEDVATRLHGARVFTVLDVRKGFWHVELEEDSSFLTTFNTPFGRYRWKRMPFGICSAPEVFQRRIHELIEWLTGVEVVADDFVVVGFGESEQEAIRDHDKNLKRFLQRCAAKGIKLNNKISLRRREVPFIGHVATDKGLCADPSKVQAITEMPRPTDVPGVQRLLGMAQYLAKFLPHLSDITKPLRELTHKEIEWEWDQAQDEAMSKLQGAISNTPVLRYYNLAEEVTIQCDASQSGLGAALMQGGQPVAYASRALTDTETRYAQIEKELLAIVFACDRFDPYIYGRDLVSVESDHQPLEAIMKKPLNDAPKRLQRMLLRLQKYPVCVHYKRGSQMYLADTLSRAYLPHQESTVEVKELEYISHAESLAWASDDLQRLKQASAQDVALQELSQVIRQGWPPSKTRVLDAARPYFNFRDQMTVQDDLVFKGARVVIPATLRREMMNKCHETHIGIEGCLRRARESMYWPRMTSDIKDHISKCDVCLAHQNAPQKETLHQHQIIDRPWAKVGADLCDLSGRTLLVVCDYFSGFVEVEWLQTTTSNAVSKAMKVLFARYGIPNILVSDNGPQFAAAEFAAFANRWGFHHVTSSPRYPQSNGKVENAVKTVKRLFTKCQEDKQSEYQALLDWQNTPTEALGSSPAQRFLGRRCRTLLPIAETLLKPAYDTSDDARALKGKRAKQAHYFNQQARDLPPIAVGETVRLRLPGEKRWTQGTCTGCEGPRSYTVRVGGAEYRRNRRHLIRRGESPIREPPAQDMPVPRGDDAASDNRQIPERNISDVPPEPASMYEPLPEPEPDEATETAQTQRPEHVERAQLRRSTRQRRPPEWITNYVPTST